jgi:hypothetical protein
MAKIVAMAVCGLMAAFGISQVDFPALGQRVAQQAAQPPDQGAPAVDMAALFRLGHH